MDTGKQRIRNLSKKLIKLFTLKKILLGLGILIFLTAAFWINFNQVHWQYYDANKRTVEAYLTHMSREEHERAYSLFAEKYKKEADYATFKKSVLPYKTAFVDYKLNSFAITRTTRFFLPLDPATLRYTGEISYRDGEKAPITVFFIWEHGDWVLYIVEFNAPNSRLENIE